MLRINLISELFCLTLLLVAEVLSQKSNPQPYLRQATITQTGSVVHISANSFRPLEQVLDALQLKYGWVVDYEDPQYLVAADLTSGPVGAAPSLLPAGGNLTVEFPASSAEEAKTLQLVVDQYQRSNNPGRFELRFSQGDFYVVGIAAHDERGRTSKQQSVFDLPLTFPAEERSITDTINKICQEITTQSHIAVTLGVSPRRILDRNSVKLGGNKESARELLRKSLDATHHSLYWRLLFDPTSKGYFLNIHSSRIP